MVDTHEVTPSTPQALRKDQISALVGAGLYLVFYTLMVLFNTHPPKLPPVVWALLAPLTTILYLLLLVQALRLFCRLSLSSKQETLLMLSTMLLFLVLNPMVRDVAWKLLSGRSWQQVLSQITVSEIDTKTTVGILLSILVPFFLILTGAFFGQLIARLIRERAILVPVAIISGLVDFWGVYWGPVSAMSASAPAAVSGLATAATQAVAIPKEVALPPALAMFGNIAPPQNIGIGDFVFLAFFLTCAYRLGLSATRTMWGIFAGLLLSSILLAMNGQEIFHIPINFEYLPGLVFISGGVLVANIGYWKLNRQEWLMTGALAAVFLLLIGRSVYIGELTKPRESIKNTTIKVADPLAAMSQARKLIAANVKPGTELLTIDATFFYQNITGSQVDEWRLIAVERWSKMKLHQVREMRVSGVFDAKHGIWNVEILQQSPPDTAVMMLQALGVGKGEPLDVLKQAHGIPEKAFPLLDVRNDVSQMGGMPNQYTVHLLPNYGAIVGGRGKVLKPLPYNKLK